MGSIRIGIIAGNEGGEVRENEMYMALVNVNNGGHGIENNYDN